MQWWREGWDTKEDKGSTMTDVSLVAGVAAGGKAPFTTKEHQALKE